MGIEYLRALRRLGRDVRLFLVTAALVGFTVFGGIVSVLQNLFLLRLGYGPEFIGVFISSGMFALALVCLPAGTLGARWGSRRSMMVGLTVAAAGSGMVALAELPPQGVRAAWLVMASIVASSGLALYIVNTSPFLMTRVGPDERAHAFSAQGALWPLSAFAGSLAGGVLPGLLAGPLGAGLNHWLRGEAGQRLISRMAALCEHRGGILLFSLPPIAVRLALQPFFPLEHDWADFVSFGVFFVLGYLVLADERFTRSIRRDWWILLVAWTAATLAFGVIVVSLGSLDIEKAPQTLLEFLFWATVAACGWLGTALMLSLGMSAMNRDSRLLRYGQETLLPFFVVHQPVILVIAYFVVQWEAPILIKLLVVVLGAFVGSIGLTELVIRHVGILRVMFGMKPGHPATAPIATGKHLERRNRAI